jgi:hypothetical protein
MKRSARLFFACVPIVLASASGAAGLTDKFPLVRAVPEDVYLCVAGRPNPERAFLDRYWQRFFDEFHASGFLEELWDLIANEIPDEYVEKLEEFSEVGTRWLKSVRWSELGSGESVFAGRLTFPVPQYIYLSRQPVESVEHNFAGLKTMLSDLQKLGGSPLRIEESEFAGATIVSLRVDEAATVRLSVARRRDVLVLALGEDLLKESLGLLAGRTEKTALGSTPRFKAAFAGLPPPEDVIEYVDLKRLLLSIREMTSGLQREAGEADLDTRRVLGFADRLVADVLIFDYVATVEWTDGYRVFRESRTVLSADAKDRPTHAIFTAPPAFDRFDRFIPKKAAAFSITSGLDYVEGYHWLLDAVRGLPGGEKALAMWEDFQEEWGFHVERDLLSWLEGPIVTFTLPGSGFSGSTGAVMIKVNDEKKARRQVDRFVGYLKERFSEPPISTSPIEDDVLEGFQRVTHPFLMMVQMPPIVWGTADGYLIFSNGPRPARECLLTARDKRPSVRENPRFRREGILPDGPVVAASFTDLSRHAEEMQSMMAGVTMALGMVSAFAPLPQDATGRILRAIPPLLAKLGSVVGKLDFYQSESSATSFDGKAWLTRSVTNYKDPSTIPDLASSPSTQPVVKEDKEPSEPPEERSPAGRGETEPPR